MSEIVYGAASVNANLASLSNKIPQPVLGAVPVNAASLPLPSGAATETTLSSVNGKLPALDTGAVPVLVKNGQLEIQNDTGNPIPIGPAATQALSGSALANNTDLFSVDCSGFRSINFQITGTWVGTISFQVSNDNTNWNSLSVMVSTIGTSFSSNTTSNGCWFGSLGGFNFVRVRFTAYTSGTATVTGFLLREVIAQGAATSGATITIAGSATAPGNSITTINSAASTNATVVKNTAGNLYSISAMNTSASTKFVRIYSKSTTPTVGTDVPIMVIAIPATSSKEITYTPALRIGSGIGVAITGGAAATDSTAVAAGDVQLLVSFA